MCDELLANDTVRDMLPVIAALAASLITGLLALAAARASMKATRSDRVWDTRREGYTAILTRLNEASLRASVVDDGYNGGDYGRGPHDYFETSERADQEKAAGEAWRNCRSAFDSSWLVLSDDFLARSERLFESLPTRYDDDSPPEDAARRAQALRDGYRDLLGTARSEFASSHS